MPFPRVIPHSDGSGTIDAVGRGVHAERVGQRVWDHTAQPYRPSWTAAEFTVVPRTGHRASREVRDEVGVCLGIPGITAHRGDFGDGPVEGKTILVQGVLAAVGSMAAEVARWGRDLFGR
jgi:NADPH:quinone reductase